ncbi:MAG: sodium-dependent transporter, partial [Spirochaetia bacterium]|nr:sodium-dependent transporter [Spirochaetia bacterium]
MKENKVRETLGSRLGFILLSAGCAIGLGNVWRFPFITGRYGGAAFVLIYILFLVILGLPVMVMELAIGRASKQNIGLAMETLTPTKKPWQVYGKLAIIGNYVLMMFYTTITGWLLSYLV